MHLLGHSKLPGNPPNVVDHMPAVDTPYLSTVYQPLEDLLTSKHRIVISHLFLISCSANGRIFCNECIPESFGMLLISPSAKSSKRVPKKKACWTSSKHAQAEQVHKDFVKFGSHPVAPALEIHLV
mmetsp:Transcript_29163/g.47168  ORF Transcript_29163/g.47168 Transcript_29163/m.47168 type:complete len:126 (+) Transcript_29163:2-379(+)